MTNKINGIDVSECEFYNNYECDAYRHEYWEPQNNTKDMCKEHEDCYFKQLKRLQEENEQLKKPCLVMPKVKQLAVPIEEFKKLQEENEGLKKEVKILGEQIFKDNEQYIDLYDDYVSDFKATRKYKQALEEIRSYCDEQNLKVDYTACYIINRIDEVFSNE